MEFDPDKILLCAHCIEPYIFNLKEEKRIFKDQCIKCYDDPVRYKIIYFIIS